jgi:glucoside 3-dehydrogenase (cytochrome c) hitch-hiker subunit
MPNESHQLDHSEAPTTIDRREAIRRVSFLLGGITFIGGTSLLSACEKSQHNVAQEGQGVGNFSRADVDLLGEVADTILPDTARSPGAKAAGVGPFMALMVTDCYEPNEQKIFRDGMQKLNDACRKANNVSFVDATPQQRLSLLESLDKEAKTYTDAVEAARRAHPARDSSEVTPPDTAAKHLSDQRQEGALGANAGPATAITADSPPHYFRMMKELAMLGYFTSEIGCTKAQRYAETPGKYDPCVPYKPGDKAWAPHA